MSNGKFISNNVIFKNALNLESRLLNQTNKRADSSQKIKNLNINNNN